MRTQSIDINENKKVVFVFDSKFSNWKGTQKFFFEFGNYLKNNGFKITLIENNIDPELNLLPNGLELPFNIISFKFRKIFSSYSIPRKVIDSINPAIIYANSFNTLPLLPKNNYKVIYGMHVIHISSLKYANFTERLRFNIKKLFLSAIVIFVWKNKNIMFHALNTDQRDWIEKITHNRFPVRVIGNPVDCRIQENITFLKNMAMNKRFTLLYFGSFSPERGFSEFLSIVRFIHAKLLKGSFQFLIVGDGPLRSEAEELSKLYDNITLFIRPTDDQKRNIMLSSDLFVFPSIIETFSITAVEAQSSGLPCLFSDITPLKNIAIEGKTGYCLSLEGNFEKRFFDKINDYYQLWHNDYEGYRKMRIEIAECTRRLCKENVLPQLQDMLKSLLSNDGMK